MMDWGVKPTVCRVCGEVPASFRLYRQGLEPVCARCWAKRLPPDFFRWPGDAPRDRDDGTPTHGRWAWDTRAGKMRPMPAFTPTARPDADDIEDASTQETSE